MYACGSSLCSASENILCETHAGSTQEASPGRRVSEGYFTPYAATLLSAF